MSAMELRIIQEIELNIMKITYREIVTEDGELMVTATSTEAVQPVFETSVKNYRIMEGMSVTFHCKMSGIPLPTVTNHLEMFFSYLPLKNNEGVVLQTSKLCS